MNIRPVRVTKVRWNCSRVCHVMVSEDASSFVVCIIKLVIHNTHILKCVEIEYPEKEEKGWHEKQLEEKIFESFPAEQVQLTPVPLYQLQQ